MKDFRTLEQEWNNVYLNWIKDGITAETTKWCSEFGEYLAPKDDKDKTALTTSQLRKFFGELRRIDADFEHKNADFIMMNPILAYAIGRDKNDRGVQKTKIGDFGKILTPAITYVGTDEKRFKNFVKIFEAIVAYHKFHGGK